METFSALLALCAGNSSVTGEFLAQRPVTRGFDVFFDLRLYKQLSKESWGWWFETPSRPLWRHCNVGSEFMAWVRNNSHIVYSTVYSGEDQRKHQSSASLAFVRGIHRSPVNSPHKGPVTRKMCPFDDVIMFSQSFYSNRLQNTELINESLLWQRCDLRHRCIHTVTVIPVPKSFQPVRGLYAF